MKLLCLDTSAGSQVALVEGERVLSQAASNSARAHAESLTDLIREVCGIASGEPLKGAFDAVVVGRGPAPYTGLRAGLITARVLAKACDVPVYGVSSLEMIARAALDELPAESQVVALADARRKELYAAQFSALGTDDLQQIGDFEVDKPASLHETLPENVWRVGPGLALYPELENESPVSVPTVPVTVAARIVNARLANGRAEELGTEPLYLRRPDVQVSKKVKSTLGDQAKK
ncbi:tRNA (adenosine(37)-N6)-threonylcarbamoyltransferase complex dimerization subunit type 1 TsaB [Boudabousia tangfeifanii]|uniref:tRNA (Adenosine(37)-N6)-threonylcarbamoyltransferase complex dimerization subunit type 1 TsaB n=1 Tax=Boudabousia tangfeifanii TaxID=1912795 RepID=A0A1D9MIU4_9ACTO|nr:tRNA (adenosine(37)-N6)-threonylcarbamoyltransferase complex dimerization subunit type 1 TsaB [Boudabousia tangfeifanii]AOZ72261.1 tRNA (adenosine(37)-N6)-threonylcarbamoyltransferase complex dimerization subunit type 1 TsaB [Boudabousia tangfeifanii]